MDLLTHALVGAAAGSATRAGKEMRVAGFAGAVAALLPDIDFFIDSAQDPLLHLELHRHFTHSLAFAPIGALIAAGLLYPLLRRRLGFGALYLATLAGFATNGLIDMCTSYGVHLFWPFSDGRVALHIVSVADPVLTLGMGIPVLVALWLRRRSVLLAGLAAGLLYMGASGVQQARGAALAEDLAERRGHVPEDLLLRPSFANILLWRSLYRAEGEWFVDAIRPGITASARVYPGGSWPVFEPAERLPAELQDVAPDSRLADDLRRLDAVSEGYLIWDGAQNRIGDIRFSTLPDGVAPMWGLEVDPDNPEAVPSWFTDRTLTPAMRERFLAQLRGAPSATKANEEAQATVELGSERE